MMSSLDDFETACDEFEDDDDESLGFSLLLLVDLSASIGSSTALKNAAWPFDRRRLSSILSSCSLGRVCPADWCSPSGPNNSSGGSSGCCS